MAAPHALVLPIHVRLVIKVHLRTRAAESRMPCPVSRVCVGTCRQLPPAAGERGDYSSEQHEKLVNTSASVSLLSNISMFVTACVVFAALTPQDFLITSLPGLATPPSFKQYSGLMPIGDTAGTELFFWFVESARSPSNDPVVFWTNGGPGASSVAYGFWTEHGPFRLERSAGSVAPVPYNYSWNRIANVLYVEMPSGVGFSQSTDSAKYRNIADEEAAGDTYAFLVKFFEVFTQFQTSDLYVTGESYGGRETSWIRTHAPEPTQA